MAPDPQNPFPTDYRSARRAFIAACEGRGVDVISRVHPKAKGPDGAPLFLDMAALGKRHASRALLLLSGISGAGAAFGSATQARLMRMGIMPPPGARLVMVHAVNPFGFAWNMAGDENDPGNPDSLFADGPEPGWPARALAAIRTEDLADVGKAIVLSFQADPVQADRSPAAARLTVGGNAAHMARARAIWGGEITRAGPDMPGAGLAHMLTTLLAPDELTLAILETGPGHGAFSVDMPQEQEQAWDHALRHVTAALAALA